MYLVVYKCIVLIKIQLNFNYIKVKLIKVKLIFFKV